MTSGNSEMTTQVIFEGQPTDFNIHVQTYRSFSVM